MLDFGADALVFRQGAENLVLLVLAYLGAVFLTDANGGFQHVQAAGRQGVFQGFAGGKAALDKDGPIGLQQLVTHWNGDFVSVCVKSLQFCRKLLGTNDIGSSVGIAPVVLLFVIQRHIHVQRFLKGGAHPQVPVYIIGIVEFQGLARGVRHPHFGLVEAVLLGGESEGEAVVGLQFLLLFQHHGAVTGDLDLNVGAREVMAGIAADGAGDRDFAARQVQFRERVEGEVETGQHELVHAEGLGGLALHFNVKITAPKARGNGERAGDRAPLVGFQFLGFQHIVFGILQAYGHALAYTHLHALGRASVKEDGLELDFVARVVGAAVQIDVAVVVVIVQLDIIPAGDSQRRGTAVSADGLQRVVGAAGQLLFKGFRQRREAVQAQRGAGHFLLAASQKADGGRLEGLSGLVIRHVHAAAVAVLAGGQRQGELCIIVLSRVFAALGFHGIAAVREFRKVYAHGVLHVVTLGEIDHFPGLDRVLSLPEGEIGYVEVLEDHLDGLGIYLKAQVPAIQFFQNILDADAAVGQGTLVSAEYLAAGFKGLGVGAQVLILQAGSLVLVQCFLFQNKQVGLGVQAQGFIGILGLKGL